MAEPTHRTENMMNPLPTFRIGRTLGGSVALVILVSVLAMAISWLGMRSTQTRLDGLIQKEQALYDLYTEMYAQGLQMGQALRNTLLDPQNRIAYQNYDKARTAFDEQLVAIRFLPDLPPAVEEEVEQIKQLSAQQFEVHARILGAVHAGHLAQANQLLAEEETPLWRAYKQILLDGRNLLHAQVESGRLEVAEMVDKAGKVTLLAGGLSMLIASMTTLMLARALRQREARLQEQREAISVQKNFLDTVIHGLQDPVLVINPAHQVIMANRAAEGIMHTQGESPLQQPCYRLLHGLDAPCDPAERHCPLHEQLKNGEYMTMLHTVSHLDQELLYDVTVTPLRNEGGEIKAIVECMHDVTFSLTGAVELQLSKERLYRQAHRDQLTDLPNRRSFEEELEAALRSAGPDGQTVALLFLDLDGFKDVNDTLGHQVGDELLRVIAARLKQCVRRSDFVGRLAGDEFVFVITSLNDQLTLERIGEKILQACREPMLLAGNNVHVTGSLGMALYPQDADNAPDLIKHADIAMYSAKSSGRNRLRFFHSEMDSAVRDRFELAQDVQSAITNQEFFLVYQPQLHTDRQTMRGVEALMRWQSPNRGLVSPNLFIPLLEESGLIRKLNAWLLEESISQLASWMAAGASPLVMSINLSATEFEDPTLLERIAATLARHQVPPQLLELEITERIAIDNPDFMVKLLGDLRAMGVRTAMDDFGTGYSSLSYLTTLPIDTLKIDRSFIRTLPHSEKSRGVVQMIAGMSGVLGMEIVAEGVEIGEEWNFIRDSGCQIVQGFLFGKPQSPEQIQTYVDNLKNLSPVANA